MVKLTTQQFIEKAKAVHGNRYDYSCVDYSGSKNNINIICKTHGKFSQTPNNHLRGKGCEKCGRVQAHKTRKGEGYVKSIFEKARQIHKNFYDYSESRYNGYNNYINIKCPKHGIFSQRVSNHLNGNGCPKCRAEKISRLLKTDNDYFINKIKKLPDRGYSYNKTKLDGYKNKVTITCSDHGDFKQLPGNHLKGYGCPKCSINNSSLEDEIEDFLSRNDINFVRGCRSLIKPLEVDFYLQDYSLAIECNGIYWHSENAGRGRDYHTSKLKMCQDKQVNLIQLWETEIRDKKPYWESILCSRFGKNKKEFARKLVFTPLSREERKSFFEDNHIHGDAAASHQYGLRNVSGQIMAAISFRRNRFSKNDNTLEVIRMANTLGSRVIGGLNKLIENSRKELGFKKLHSYCDRRIFDGSGWKSIGFEKVGVTPPNYFYFHKKDQGLVLYSRQKFQKHKLVNKLSKFDSALTEWENMKKNGWNRVWDCGHIKLEKTWQ